MEEMYIVNPKSQNIAINIIIDKIDNGYKLQKLDNLEGLDSNERLKLIDSIIIAPDYQREYRSSVIDESSLIESVLVGIPIPPVFLANDRYQSVQVMNVVDGQHRLRAFHRFINNKFKLTGLTLLKNLNGNNFEECEFGIKEKLLSYELPAIVFKDFPGKEFELEIFNRYNKGTKPLTQQEIRHAVYNSNVNSFVNKFAYNLIEEKSPLELFNSYNATKDRFQKKKLHESIFVILSILENGINDKYEKSSIYAEEYMKEKSEMEKSQAEQAYDNYLDIVNRFNEFNKLITLISNKIEYPFSKEIYGVSSRNYKFQISIAMIIAGIFNKILKEDGLLERIKEAELIEELIKLIAVTLEDSFIEDPEYSGSSTNSKELSALLDMVNVKAILD